MVRRPIPPLGPACLFLSYLDSLKAFDQPLAFRQNALVIADQFAERRVAVAVIRAQHDHLSLGIRRARLNRHSIIAFEQ